MFSCYTDKTLIARVHLPRPFAQTLHSTHFDGPVQHCVDLRGHQASSQHACVAENFEKGGEIPIPHRAHQGSGFDDLRRLKHSVPLPTGRNDGGRKRLRQDNGHTRE